jgi:hypothetical protein
MSVEQQIKETTIRNRPMPEVFRRNDIRNSGGWDVGHAPAVRGEPFITVSGRIMRVPLDDSELSQAIRAHEQIHVKISPQDLTPYITELTPEMAIRSAEEARVNFIASELGFPMKSMVTGGDKHDGKVIAGAEDWASAVYAVGASCFTGGLTPLISGVRSVNPDWASALRDLAREVKKFMKSQVREIKKRKWGVNSTSTQDALVVMGSTALNEFYDGNNYVQMDTIVGMNHTIALAMLLQAVAEMPPPTGYNEQEDSGEAGEGEEGEGEEVEGQGELAGGASDENGDGAEQGENSGEALKGDGKAEGDPSDLEDETQEVDREGIQNTAKNILRDKVHEHGGQAKWQPVKIGPTSRSLTVQGAIGKRRVPANMGKNPRRMHRFLTDPDRRIFDKYVKASGGVVIIDMSGSMSLSKDQVKDMMLASKGCLIIGYSGGREDRPNTWILGDKGKIVDDIPRVNGGNLCDLSVAEYAIEKRQNAKAPVIWITDGMCYKEGYHGQGWTDELECAKFALKHKIHMEYEPEGAIDYLKGLQRGDKPNPRILERWREMFTLHLAR